MLHAAEATIHGDSPRYESGGGKDNIGYWHDPKDYVDWEFKLQKPGVYRVEIVYSCQAGAEGSEFAVAMGDQSLSGRSKSTGDWSKFTTEELGTLKIGKAGSLYVGGQTESRAEVEGHRTAGGDSYAGAEVAPSADDVRPLSGKILPCRAE